MCDALGCHPNTNWQSIESIKTLLSVNYNEQKIRAAENLLLANI
jgi:hypothetical protein